MVDMKGIKMKLLKWGKHSENEVDHKLESYMDSTLQPVSPRPEYVRRLRKEILNQYYVVRDEVTEQRQRDALLIGASLVGGILTVMMGIRIMVTVVAAIILLFQWKKPSRLQILAPERTAK
jgi:hypothetical protein